MWHLKDCRSIRVFVILIGIALSTIFVWSSQDTHSVIAEFLEGLSMRRTISSLDPQTREEFWEAVDFVVRTKAENWSPYNPSVKEIVEILIKDAVTETEHGNMIEASKPWATDEFRQKAIEGIHNSHRWGPYSHLYPNYDERGLHANRVGQTVFWSKLFSCFVVGGGFIWLGLMFLPYFIILVLFFLVTLGRVSGMSEVLSYVQDVKIVQPANNEQSRTQSSFDLDDETDLALPAVLTWSIPLLFVLGFITTETMRLRKPVYHWFSARAPPWERRYQMRFLVLLGTLIALLLVPASQASDSVYLQFGEWANARASGMAYIHDGDRIKHNPFVFFNGEVVDYLCLYHLTKSDQSTVSLGPVAGFQSKKEGIIPYCGFVFRSCYALGSFESSFLFAARHTHKERLHHIFIVGLMRHWRAFSFGLAYQPIRKDGPDDYWNDRVAATLKLPLKYFTLILEGRTSLEEGHRTSMNLDVSIPLN